MWWLKIVFIVGRTRRPLLTAQERLPPHRAEVQSFKRNYRVWATGVHPVMVPAGMEPRVAEVYVGFNIWHDPFQGFYWVDGFAPAFWTPGEARAFALTQVPPVFAPVDDRSVLPFAAIIAAASLLL